MPGIWTGSTVVALAMMIAEDRTRATRLAECCEALGCRDAGYGFVNALRVQLPTCTTLPNDWQEVYFEQGYHMIDPVIGALHGSRRVQSLDHLGSNRDFCRIWHEHAADFGIAPPRVGVPMFGPYGETAACVFFYRDAPASAQERRRVLGKCRRRAEAFHEEVLDAYGIRDASGFPSLSEREKQVVFHYARGMATVEIAREMDVSPRTVETHARNCRRKLQARNMTHAAARAVYFGTIPTPDPE